MAIRLLLRFRTTRRIKNKRRLGLRVNFVSLAKSVFHSCLAGIVKAGAGVHTASRQSSVASWSLPQQEADRTHHEFR